MAFEVATAALCRLAFRQGDEEARRRPPSVIGLSSARSSPMRASSLTSVVFHTAQQRGSAGADGIQVELTLIFDLTLIFNANNISGLLLWLAVIRLDICLAFT